MKQLESAGKARFVGFMKRHHKLNLRKPELTPFTRAGSAKSWRIRFLMCWRILWRAESLLCNDRKLGGYTRVVSGQRLGKHVPAAMEKLCFLRVPCRDFISKGQV
jgi:hypothetical protein